MAAGIQDAAAADIGVVEAVGIAAVGIAAVAAAEVVGIAAVDKVAAAAEVAAAEAVDWGWGFPKKTARLLPPHQLLQRKLPRAASGVVAEVVAEVEGVAGIAVAVGPVAVVGIVEVPVAAAEAAQVGWEQRAYRSRDGRKHDKNGYRRRAERRNWHNIS